MRRTKNGFSSLGAKARTPPMNPTSLAQAKSRLPFLALAAALGAAGLAAVAFAHLAHVRGGRIARLEAQLAGANAEVARLDALVKQAESESGHPIYSNQ